MKTNIALISAPWSFPVFPSIQIGALKAYIDHCNIKDVTTSSHSAFIEIPYRMFSFMFFEKFFHASQYEEYPYTLALIKRFYPHYLNDANVSMDTLIDLVVQGFAKELKFQKKPGMDNSEYIQIENGQKIILTQMVDRMITVSEEYVCERILPHENTSDLNLYCFTLNYHQVASSIFLAKMIQEKSMNKNNIFIFGGMSAAIPNVVDLLAKADLPAFCVLGEGEKKMELIANSCAKAYSYENTLEDISKIQGVFSVKNPVNLWEKDKKNYDGQFSDLSKLPIPDYDDFFSFIESICDGFDAKEQIHKEISILMEGTRGCFAKCSFCGLNYVWNGFRKMDHEVIFERLLEHTKRYRLYNLVFVDNVCDTWAEGFATKLINKKLNINTFYEMRAHHPEEFWTKLAISGATSLQVGIEALSESVLKSIGKGTTVAQNVLVQKYMMELDIESHSNLITHYPSSTPADVEETKNLISRIPHFPKFNLVPFMMVMGSPIYEKLSSTERRKLKPLAKANFPNPFNQFQIDFGYFMPDGFLSEEARNAWADFYVWYDNFLSSLKDENISLTCEELSDGSMRIVDRRQSPPKTLYFNKEAAQVYEHTHAASSIRTINKKTGFSDIIISKWMHEFDKCKIVYQTFNGWVALATRPRDVLISRYLDNQLSKNQSEAIKDSVKSLSSH